MLSGAAKLCWKQLTRHGDTQPGVVVLVTTAQSSSPPPPFCHLSVSACASSSFSWTSPVHWKLPKAASWQPIQNAFSKSGPVSVLYTHQPVSPPNTDTTSFTQSNITVHPLTVPPPTTPNPRPCPWEMLITGPY